MSIRRSGTPAVLAFLLLAAPAFGHAASTLTVIDNEPVDEAAGEPGPGDNMVFSVRRNATYVAALSFTTGQPGEIVSHRLAKDGQLEFVGRSPAGPEPRQIALARKGDYAVVVNSSANEIAAMRVNDDGSFTEVDRVPSGGVNPYDVAALKKDIVVVANRDSDEIQVFGVSKEGKLRPLDDHPTGIDPHVVSVSSRGLVAVANQTDRSVGVYTVNRRGEITELVTPIPMSVAGTDARMTPRTASWRGRDLFVALDADLPAEDVIRPFTVTNRGVVTQGADVACGFFLTDLEANADGIFAVTVNLNGSDPDRNETRVYHAKKLVLTQDAAVQTDGPPSFKQVSTFPGKKAVDRHVVVTEFQNGALRSLVYDRRKH